MDMNGHNHGSMSMGVAQFQSTNIDVAHAFWYIVAAICAVRGARSLIDILRNALAKRQNHDRSAVPSRPSNILTQTYETTLAMFRELSYPAMQPFAGRITQYFTPPPLGQCLFILTYWGIILTMLWSDVLLARGSSQYAYRWEKPAFRAAWVSVTQVPLVYALSCKINVISIVTGVSYERLNWLHRWVARTLFLTVIVHWAYFFHEWTLADFVKYQFEIMPMVKYGFGAWAVIGWSVLLGFGYFRHLCYELWVLQHLASAGVLLWLLWVHVPSYARYNIWMAVAFVAFDRIFRGLWSLARNLHLQGFGSKCLGFQGEVAPLKDGYLRLTLKDVNFHWKPGQHVFLSIPACGIFESHPFTIANRRLGPTFATTDDSRDLEIVMKCHSGFTKRLLNRAKRQQEQNRSFPTHQVFLSGPWGIPPITAIERSNALVFIASSTGASYTLPLLEHAIEKAPFVNRIHFYWIVRHTSQVSWFDSRLRAAAQKLATLGVHNFELKIFITTPQASTDLEKHKHSLGTLSQIAPVNEDVFDDKTHESDREIHYTDCQEPVFQEETHFEVAKVTYDASTSSSFSGTESSKTGSNEHHVLPISLGRPESFDHLIRPAVESAQGETVVVACGGKQLMAQIRTYIAGLSDERAVHKGTGAQSIYFWGETYGW